MTDEALKELQAEDLGRIADALETIARVLNNPDSRWRIWVENLPEKDS